MSISYIDSTTVTVENFTDLKNALEASTPPLSDVRLIYLLSDITIERGGITINPSRAEIVVDGIAPGDPADARHTITDYNSASSSDLIGIRRASSMYFTMRNLIWSGQNIYGIFYHDTSSSSGLVIRLENIRYTGPQMVFNHYATTQFIDCDVDIVAGHSGAGPQEFGQVTAVEIGGTTTVNHTYSTGSDSMFWFNYTGASLTILEGAEVTMASRTDMIYESSSPFLVLERDSALTLRVQNGVFRSNSHVFDYVEIGENASLSVIQEGSFSRSVLNCDGPFHVRTGASVYLERTGSGNSLLRFTSSDAYLTVEEPKSVVFYCEGNPIFDFNATTGFSLTGGQINLWTTATTPVASAGGFDDLPAGSWRKSTDVPATITGTASGGSTAIASTNFTAEELQSLPPLGNLLLQNAQVLSIGSLPLTLEPVTDDGWPVSGVTEAAANIRTSYRMGETDYTKTDQADSEGVFAMDTEQPIPLNTTVTVTANKPFFLSALTSVAVDAGELLLLQPPATIEFVIASVSQAPRLFGRKQTDWKLQVQDTRVRSTTWKLYATTDGDMTSYDELDQVKHTLPGALVFAGEDSAVIPMGTDPVLIWSGDANGGASLTTDVTWSASKGLLLTTSSNPFWSGDRYIANISWTLEADVSE